MLKLHVQTTGARNIVETSERVPRKGWDTNICSPAILHGESQPRINLTLLSFKYLSLEIPYPIKHQPHKITAPSHLPLMYFPSFPFPFYQLKHTAHNSEVSPFTLGSPGPTFLHSTSIYLYLFVLIYIFSIGFYYATHHRERAWH